MYKKLNDPTAQAVQRTADFAVIPFDPANTDYQRYLAWLAKGNVPIPAEEQQ